MKPGLNLIFEQLRVGGDRNFAYLIGDRSSRVAAVVDPSYAPELLQERAEAQQLAITHLLNTHSHQDHANGNDAFSLPLSTESFTLGSIDVELIPVPGHTDDHLLVYLPKHGIICTGDHLFVGKIGGTGSEEAARQQFESFQKMRELLPLETTIWPGHDYGCRPSSTWKLELETNPFLLAPSFEAFLELKANWPTFKKEHGLK